MANLINDKKESQNKHYKHGYPSANDIESPIQSQSVVQRTNKKNKGSKGSKGSKGRITIHLQQQNTDNIISISVKSKRVKSKWFVSDLKRKIRRRFKITMKLYINVRYCNKLLKGKKNELISYGLADGDTLVWSWSKQKDALMLSFQVPESDTFIKVWVTNKTEIRELQEFVSKRVKYQFNHNGIILAMTDCIGDYEISNGDIIVCQLDDEKGLDSIIVDKIIKRWCAGHAYEADIDINVCLCIKRYLLIPNMADLLGIPIYVICDIQSCMDKLTELESNKPDFVGFDCEWERGKDRVCLIQIANKHMILLIRVHLFKIPGELRRFCSNGNIKKCGVNIKNDSNKLRKNHQIILNGYIELTKYAQKKKRRSLEKLCQDLLKQPMLFKQSINHWRWRSKQLDHVQISYASDDALVGYLLYEHIIAKQLAKDCVTKPKRQPKYNKNTIIYNHPHGAPCSIAKLMELQLCLARTVCVAWVPLNIKNEWFGKFGNIIDVFVVGEDQLLQSKRVQITFETKQSAINAIQYINSDNCNFDNGRKLKATFKITYYCKQFLLPNQKCTNYKCKKMHLWSTADDVVSKEENNYNDNNKLMIANNYKYNLCEEKFKHWLCEVVRLKEYLSIFVNNEYNDITMVEFIDEDVIKNELEINNKTHIKLLLKHIDEFKEMRRAFNALLIRNKTLKQFEQNLIQNGILTIYDLKKDIQANKDVKRILKINNKQEMQQILNMIHAQSCSFVFVYRKKVMAATQ